MKQEEQKSVSGDFSKASVSHLTDQLKTIMGKVDHLFLADDHRNDETHKVLTDPSIMKTLSESGVKTIRMEALDLDTEIVMRAAVNGEIPVETIESYAKQEHFTDHIGGNFLRKPGEKEIVKQFDDIAKLAHKNGIEVKSIDRNDGHMPETLVKPSEDLQKHYANFMIEKIKATPDFAQLDQKGMQTFFSKAQNDYKTEHPGSYRQMLRVNQQIKAADKEFMNEKIPEIVGRLGITAADTAMTPEKIASVRNIMEQDLIHMGKNSRQLVESVKDLNDVQAYEKMKEPFVRNWLSIKQSEARMEKDPTVANRIMTEHKEGEKEVCVYGSRHFERSLGDIDATIGDKNSAVLCVSSNIKAHTIENAQDMNDLEHFVKQKFDDPYDYTLDTTSGEWTDGTTGQKKTLEIPEGIRPQTPIAEETTLTQKITPSPETVISGP